MTQSALDSFALAQGIGKATKDMTEQEKVALRYKFVIQQLSGASGDFARTSDSWANQTRLLKLQFESLRATIGQGLINVLLPVIKTINVLLGKLTTLANAFKSFTELITGNKSSGQSSGLGGLAKDSIALSDGLSGASDSADNLSDATNGVGKAAKKAAKEMQSLMGFDAINKLSENTDSDSENGAGSGAGIGDALGQAVDYGNLAEGESAIDKLSNKFQSLIDRAKELTKLFKKGFEIGFGDSEKKIDSIKKQLNNIGKSLKDIATDQRVADSFNGMFDSIALNTGKVAGSMASIGLSIVDNLIGGVDKYLEQDGDFIKDRLVGIFDATSEIADLEGEYSVAVANIFSVLDQENAKNATANFIGIFANTFLGVTELALRLKGDLESIVLGPIIDNQEKIKAALDGTLGVVASVLGTINTSVKETVEKFLQMYDEHIAPFFQSIREGLSEILGVLLDGYNNYVLPVMEELAQRFDEVWKDHVQPVIDKAIELIGKVFDLLKALWENLLVPLLKWMADNFMKDIANILSEVGNVFLLVLEYASDALGGVIDALGGLIDFLTGVFTGDWEKAWNGIKDFFGGIWDAMVAIFQFAWELIKSTPIGQFFMDLWNGVKDTTLNIWNAISGGLESLWNGITSTVSNVFTGVYDTVSGIWNSIVDATSSAWNSVVDFVRDPINSIIGFLNNLISGCASAVNNIAEMFNNLQLDIPDWVPYWGGGTLGFSLPTWSPGSIPYLANGGYVKANTPQLAVIGDNRHQGEVVAPEGKLQEIVDEAVRRSSGGGIAKAELETIVDRAVMRIVAALSSLGFNIDGQEMATVMRMVQDGIDRRYNDVGFA